MNVIEKATRIAVEVHKDQKRKNDDCPYIVHPFIVAMKVAQHGFGEDVIAAALVHDVLEDSDVTPDILNAELGDTTVSIVQNVSEDKSLPWEERKKQYVERVRNGAIEIKAVSVSDKIHNLENMLESYEKDGDAIWEKFNRGKKEQLWFNEILLDMFKKEWNHPLVDEYEQLVVRLRDLM